MPLYAAHMACWRRQLEASIVHESHAATVGQKMAALLDRSSLKDLARTPGLTSAQKSRVTHGTHSRSALAAA